MNFQHRVQTPLSLADTPILGVVLLRFFPSFLDLSTLPILVIGPTVSIMLRVDISSLDEGIHEQTLSPAAGDLELDPEIFDKIALDLRLDVAERRVLASFDVRGVATLRCDRTLAMYQQPVRGDHAVLFVPPEQIPDDSDDDALQPLPDPEKEINLAAAVRDTLMLSLPLRRVAPEAEQAEITTSYGEQVLLDGAPVDDRWEALRELRSDNSD